MVCHEVGEVGGWQLVGFFPVKRQRINTHFSLSTTFSEWRRRRRNFPQPPRQVNSQTRHWERSRTGRLLRRRRQRDDNDDGAPGTHTAASVEGPGVASRPPSVQHVFYCRSHTRPTAEHTHTRPVPHYPPHA